MGVYDCINVKCPICDLEYMIQSKGGPCEMKDYLLHECPEGVLVDANRHAPYKCECGIHFEVDIEKRETVVCQPRPHKDHLGVDDIIEGLEKEKKPEKNEFPKMNNNTNIKIDEITGHILIIDEISYIPVRSIDWWERLEPDIKPEDNQSVRIWLGPKSPLEVFVSINDLIMKIQACGLIYEQKRMAQAMGNVAPMIDMIKGVFQNPGAV